MYFPIASAPQTCALKKGKIGNIYVFYIHTYKRVVDYVMYL